MHELATIQGGGLSRLDLYALFERELDASEKTRATYTRSLRQWRKYLEAHGTTETEATRETVIAYRDELQKAGKSAATVNAYLTAVKAQGRFTRTCRQASRGSGATLTARKTRSHANRRCAC